MRVQSIFLACSILRLSVADHCGTGVGALWSAEGEKGDLSFTLSEQCTLQTPVEFVSELADRHVYVAGDAALRLAVQHFERDWEACVPSTSKSSRADAESQDHELCGLAYGRNVYAWLKRPMDRFALTFESTPFVRDQHGGSEWWRKWVVDFDRIPEHEFKSVPPGQSLDDRTRMARLPDVIILGNWARHVDNWQGKKTLTAFVEGYEKEVRAFITALVATPAYEQWWRHGRLVWRLALPSDWTPPPPSNDRSATPPSQLFYGQDSVDGCNEVAVRLFRELAPGVRVVDQAALVQRPDSIPRHAFVLGDSVLYKPPIQVLLMRNLLAVALSIIEAGGSAVVPQRPAAPAVSAPKANVAPVVPIVNAPVPAAVLPMTAPREDVSGPGNASLVSNSNLASGGTTAEPAKSTTKVDNYDAPGPLTVLVLVGAALIFGGVFRQRARLCCHRRPGSPSPAAGGLRIP